MNFNGVALELALVACRTLWAQPNPILGLNLGLLFLGTGLCENWSVCSGLSALKGD